jgi:hypothetical protein
MTPLSITTYEMKTLKQALLGLCIGVVFGLACARFAPGRYQVHISEQSALKIDTWTGDVWLMRDRSWILVSN